MTRVRCSGRSRVGRVTGPRVVGLAENSLCRELLNHTPPPQRQEPRMQGQRQAMNFSSLPGSPAGLKSVNPYLQRAKEMEKVDPVISYWCAFHAAQTCMSIGHNEPESREFLMRLLDLLEHAKTQLSENDAITNNLAATAYVENFALKIFDGADKEDQQGLSTRTTAQRFLAAACFLEVLQSLTNQPEPDIMQKIKYSKWKAGSISKAIRDGNSTSQPASEGVARSPVESLNRPNHAEVRDLPPLPESARSQEGYSDWPTELATSSMTKLPSPVLAPNLSATNSSGKPSPFPSTVFPPTSQNTNPSLPAPDFPAPSPGPPGLPSTAQPPATHLSRFPVVPGSSSSIEPTSTQTSHPVQQTFYSTSAASVPPNNTHSTNLLDPATSLTQPSSSSSSSHNNNNSAIQIPSTLPTSNTLVNPIKIAQAQKHAKWAISALNFDDISTAKNQLQIALDTLNSL
ncbi:uncharacterized protein PGTG_05653 [Puccinia graminis f. sp. tritici CRL 75-36-700-3]|uniref:Vacuolar protein sorting-associated protein VTA1 n=2 Tax=Puccinia graminis f. sp. tritici TaxID=56615 RepID=E3K517_PUCGT|nr:uncharacterized protein PGTG_05653 [Puccinia graminis f. sp. tritici CRL 75-36-700-3]EFP79332.1 hypothetical protein PGTG_05653 [Puccinia graminis f. sp. tritici CRL 75-36-700-3]